ncbi:glycerophosphodiester phosphodiesterase [Nocardioides sp. Kera G14]|uniref:glycerophosphodiester phosphodiesterase n=1 Tax=Nocardioides sp. Kera G14 TaxID=2884264 RepID=UPI001D12E068|nr:glycerophosphodiester phosphodiesterase [Nocardioides sp. Kera G14]UDY25223.1 glycerophosphodiester phosphodiesterase [Nocardioides sp. Kera G14]
MPIRAFAHRGGAMHPDLLGHENTLRAFQHAVALGYRDIETDVHLTHDGVLVAFHDAVLDRVTDRTGAISDLPYAEIATARIGGSEPIPTLEELVESLPAYVGMNIDLKAPGTAEALATFLRERDLEKRVIIGSFSTAEMARFRRITEGRVATSATPGEVAAYLASPLAFPLRRLGASVLQIPHRRKGVTICSSGVVRRAHANGLEVHAWTIDDADEINLLLDRGVDGIFTDRTDILRDVLISRGEWHRDWEGS